MSQPKTNLWNLGRLRLSVGQRGQVGRLKARCWPLLLELLEDRTLLATNWVEQGPGPTLNGQVAGMTTQGSPVAGAISAIAVHPTNPDIVYAGAVNGGIWKTTNATATSPTWTALTDFQLPALSIRSLAIGPLDPNTIFAGTGSASSLDSLGSPGFGVVRSADGGNTWTVLAAATFAGMRITSIVPTTLDGGNVVLASTDTGSSPGVYRSTDGGNSFNLISGTGGLPNGTVSALVADPGDANVFYADQGTQGVFRSDDGGVNWAAVNTGLTGLGSTSRILLSVHNSLGNNVVYAALITTNGELSGVFRSTNQGGSWTEMGAPVPAIFPGAQGDIHGAIAADRANPNVVFISGDRQNSPFPNANGCSNFTGNTFRGDAALLPGNPWQSVDCNGADGTSPHADARAMVFDPSGNLVEANDGGIYRLNSPNTPASRVWVSINGNIRPAELHSVAYDPLSNIAFGGAQDTGTTIQSTPGSFTWSEFLQGDGGNVAVDADQSAHPGTTIRYTSFQNFNFFNRTTWDAANNFLGLTQVGLHITSGAGTGLTLFQSDPNIQFYQPFVLNSVNPSRMLIGTANIYESMNKGDSLANLGFTGFFIGDFIGATPMAYGGRLGGVPNANVFYVGAGPTILHRATSSITTLGAYPGGITQGLVINPQNYQHVFVLDNEGRVWGSFDEGVTWVELTANLPALTSQVHSIEIFSPDTTIRNMVLIVGGLGGVFQMRRPGAAGTSWTPVGAGLPHVLVRSLQYDYTDNVLVAGTMGRGAWTLTQFFRGGGGSGLTATELPQAMAPGLAAFGTMDGPLTPPDSTAMLHVSTGETGSGGTTTATASIAKQLANSSSPFDAVKPGRYSIFVSSVVGELSQDQRDRIDDAVAALNAVLAPLGATLIEVGSVRATSADIRVELANNSPCGSAAERVLGCESDSGSVTLLAGWNWYSGADPQFVGPTQYDFETAVAHELGHALGLDHSSDPASFMYATLSPGIARRPVPAPDTSNSTRHASLAAADDVFLLVIPKTFTYSAQDLGPSTLGRSLQDLVVAPDLGRAEEPLGTRALQVITAAVVRVVDDRMAAVRNDLSGRLLPALTPVLVADALTDLALAAR